MPGLNQGNAEAGSLGSRSRGAWLIPFGIRHRFAPDRHFFRVTAVAASLLAILLLLLWRAMTRELNHDEHQFIAAAALLLRAGLLPYRDFPFFHTPDLVFIFAGLFAATSHLLLAARLFNSLSAALLLLLVFGFAVRRFRALPEGGVRLALGFTFLLSMEPFFRFTAGRAWNHDLPVLAAVAAFLSFLRSGKSGRSGLWLGACGALLGLALGTRLSFATLLAPFALATLLFPIPGRGRIYGLTMFGIGLVTALLPVALLFGLAPRQFLFDNFTYNGPINLLYRQSSVPGEITLWRKLIFPCHYFLRSPTDVLLLAGFAYFALRPWWRGGRVHWAADREISLLLFILPFLFLGSSAPTPSYRQYYYPVVPFLFLGIVIGLAREKPSCMPIARWLALAAIVSLFEATPDLRRSLKSGWPVFAAHEKGESIARQLPRGRVLTLAPLFPLEAGREIYKEFATGPFAWRTAPFVDAKSRAAFGIVAPADLEDFLAADAPAAILTGFEHHGYERPLLHYAQGHGYLSYPLPKRGMLWLPGTKANAQARPDKAKHD